MNVLAARDRFARLTDDLVVALDRLALRNIARSDLVAGGTSPVTTSPSASMRVPGNSCRVAMITSSFGCRRITWGALPA
ncbi:hypothetical protein [Paraburkholderia caribensis]|uniref:hypothetical protein n=1 Tax=Paraburkholderia caribensis TaxID=75105 RepID=UPI000A9ED172|nr:hypothetical protein [Paraburkholderia caribensis]